VRPVSSKCSDGLLLALLLVAGGAQAQVHRCTGEGGRVRYADRPCETLGMARDAEASRRLSGVTVVPYDVAGRDAAALQAALPDGFHGLARWDVTYSYRVAPTPQGTCRVTGVRTAMTGRLTVPRWTDEAQAAPALRAAWTRYLDALMRHEDGHLDTGHALARALHQDIGAATGPDCKTLRADIDHRAERLIDDHQARDRRYDAETDHGATQGARFVWP
jgi:predicted secreted Zn-dependent protease